MQTLKVVVTGASGLLGEDVALVLREKGHDIIELRGRQQLDLTNPYAVREFFSKVKPEVVIHCAGTHDIDEAERDPFSTYVNVVLTTRFIANEAMRLGAVLVYPGSDYIFDGYKDEPYSEIDLPNPLNVYGKAKVAAEKEITSLTHEYFIIRVPVLFGARGRKERNIIYNVYERIKAGETVKAASDQFSSCAYTKDVAEAFAKVISTDFYGIYHLANSGFCSRYEMYRAIALELGLPEEKVKGVPSAELRRLAKRPKYTVLDTRVFERVFGVRLREWREALRESVKEFMQVYLLGG